MDRATTLREVAEIGQEAGSDLNDGIDETGGKFGFSIEETDDGLVLETGFEPCLPDTDEPRDSDYGPPEKYRWKLIPLD